MYLSSSKVLQNATNVNVKLAMNSREKLSELPLNRFYRYVLEPYVSFDENGAMTEGPFAMFSDMPQSVLLTMGMDTPLGWMVAAVYSPYDLDNIRLREVRIIDYNNRREGVRMVSELELQSEVLGFKSLELEDFLGTCRLCPLLLRPCLITC